MKNKLLKKLNNNEGASLMLALLFFVVCAAVGSIILTAATVASGRLSGMKKDNQDFYTLRSAAEVFGKEWIPGELYLHKDDSGNVVARDQDSDLTDGQAMPTSFLSARDLMAKEVYSGGQPSVTRVFYVSVNGNSNIDQVKATVTMAPNYNLEASFSVVEEDGTSSRNTVMLSIKGQSKSAILDNKNVTSVTWSQPRIYIGGDMR